MVTLFHKIYNILIYRNWLKIKLKKVGSNFKFGYSSELVNPENFHIGNNFYCGPYAYFITNKFIPVKIGNDIMFGPFCKIFGGNHDVKYTDHHIYFAPEIEAENTEIVIEDGAWIGANSMLLNNTYISEGSVIAAGSIVNNYIPPYCIAFGSPAKRFKRRFNDDELLVVLKNVNSKYTLPEILASYDKYQINSI